MRSRSWLGIVFLALVVTSCTSSHDNATATGPTPSAQEPVTLIASLPAECTDFGEVPRRGEVTFVGGRRLYASSPDGAVVRCIGRSKRGVLPSWGGAGDRFFLQAGIGAQVVFSDDRYEFSPFGAHPLALGLSRPTGASVLFVNNGDTGLWKMDARGGHRQDISFLREHHEAIYHPAGTHIAATGIDEEGRYGIFLATNEGKEPHLLVLGEDAKRVFSLTFAPTGYLYYAAEHDERYDVHGISVEGSPTGEIISTGLATFYSDERPISKVVASQFRSDPLAIRVRTGEAPCETETVVVKKSGRKSEIPLTDGILGGVSTEPVAWLPNGDLVLTATTNNCRTTGEVFVWDGDEAKLLTTDASAVAVRGVMPDPPDPPTKVPEVIA